MKYDDIVAAIGEGAAHPGGFESTLLLLQDYDIPIEAHILEIGCGTGKTACHLAQLGYNVTAVDRNKTMLEKAKKRSEMLGVHVNFKVEDATSLSFEDNQFDVVFVESVTIFNDAEAALKQYYRVLSHGGWLYDRELYQEKRHPELIAKMSELYGNTYLPTYGEWKQFITSAGFVDLKVWNPPQGSRSLFETKNQNRTIDPLQIIDFDVLLDPSLPHFFEKNEAFITQFSDYLSYAVFIGQKKIVAI
ncbi:class I SAM-dependent methyltransferase [Paenibacillus sediminis]|uniref:SAM-dependent methyltransferase n=1 Tax=Paenibacillus sediminis TaxID=664909 RepID=A0ABS4H0U0_9BACL|nr:class I SAM-dependent methyltransferase [Paenibacillus sediminis]MBP1936144.1 SAM-dependent methyltransferase [Paenibacillus sediminis]